MLLVFAQGYVLTEIFIVFLYTYIEEIILREIAFLSYLVLQGYKGNAHDTLDVNHHKNILTGETIIKSIGFADSAVRVFQAEVFLKR